MTEENPKVTVLLTTFNGSCFLDEQLASLNGQQNVEVEVIVNDDGSFDGTMEVLNTWKERGLIVSVFKSNRIGSTKAFLKLLQECNTSQYVAFCDQDDIWEPEKLAKQVSLCEKDVPTLVFSRRRFINSSGVSVGFSPNLKRKPNFGNALIENIAPGNTILLNFSAVKKVNEYRSPEIAHYDAWLYLLISAFGQCKFINEPLVRYRIHENNQIGLRKYNLHNFETSALNFLQQAAHLFNEHKGFLSQEKIKKLSKLNLILQVSRKREKVKATLRAPFKRQKLFDQIAIKLVILLLIAKGVI